MTIHYSTGTVTVTNGSTTVTGVGTSWLSNGIMAGDLIFVRNQIGVIANVASATSLTLQNAWTPATASASAYAIMQVNDAARGLAAANQWVATFNSGPAQGRFGDGSAATPGIGFASQTNTGIFRPATSVLAISVNATERARFTTAGLQVTGAITGTAVTQSATDTTAGRLLKVGDGGILGLTATTADFNTAPAGFVGVGGTSGLNRPEVSGGGGASALTWSYSADFAIQLGAALSPINGLAWRAKVSGAWGGWRLFFDRSNILGAVSQSSGVPTGAIVQRGSNSNGEFVRFADGTQICTFDRVLSSLAITAAFGSIFRSALTGVWTYPASFSSLSGLFLDSQVASGTGAFASLFGSRPATPTLTGVDSYVFASVSGTYTDVPIRHIAIGRWF